MEIIKCISLHQPYASFMAEGLKKNETRSWSTNYRGPLLIHAAARKPKDHEIGVFRRVFKITNFGNPVSSILDSLPLGCIVCMVNIIDCKIILRSSQPKESELEFFLGDYRHGRFMWITDNLVKFNIPIPFKGAQGLFNVPKSIIPVLMEE